MKIESDILNGLVMYICNYWNKQFLVIVSSIKSIKEGKYKLPKEDGTTGSLRIGGITLYITKVPDPFDIEYNMLFRINKKLFIEIIDKYMYKYDSNFSFEKYTYNIQILSYLSECMLSRYGIKPDIYIKGGYIEFKFTLFLHPQTRIIDI